MGSDSVNMEMGKASKENCIYGQKRMHLCIDVCNIAHMYVSKEK